MRPLPPPPPPPYTPSSLEQTKPSTYHIITSKQSKKTKNNQNHTPENVILNITKPRTSNHHPILRQPKKTNPVIWFGAILCLLFSLLLIFLGVATIIIFVSIKPQNPAFDTRAAALGVVYFDSPGFFNSDLTILANFSNPNKRLGVRFEYACVELYFYGDLMATHAVEPFSQRPGEVKLVPVHLLSSLVYLPPDLAVELRKQVLRNRVVYVVKGSFRVRMKMGIVHYSYWLQGECQVEMTSPPNGVMIRHRCRTKR